MRIERDLRSLSDMIPPPDARVDETTWGSASTLPEEAEGKVYPFIIGYPGTDPSSSGTNNPRKASPALVYDTGGANSRPYVIAAHRVDAEQVAVYAEVAIGAVLKDVEHVEDDLGREIAIVTLNNGELDTPFVEPQVEVMVGWQRRTGWGGAGAACRSVRLETPGPRPGFGSE